MLVKGGKRIFLRTRIFQIGINISNVSESTSYSWSPEHFDRFESDVMLRGLICFDCTFQLRIHLGLCLCFVCFMTMIHHPLNLFVLAIRFRMFMLNASFGVILLVISSTFLLPHGVTRQQWVNHWIIWCSMFPEVNDQIQPKIQAHCLLANLLNNPKWVMELNYLSWSTITYLDFVLLAIHKFTRKMCISC